MKLIQLAQVTPNSQGVEAPSRKHPDIEISKDEFNAKYANNTTVGLVSFDKDGVSNPREMVKYFCTNRRLRGRVIIRDSLPPEPDF
jgi:hypothetical protein